MKRTASSKNFKPSSRQERTKSEQATWKSNSSKITKNNSEENCAKMPLDGTPKKRSLTLWSRTKSTTWKETERNKSASSTAFTTTRPTQWDINWEKRTDKLKTRPENSTNSSKSTKCWSISSRKSSAREQLKRISTSRCPAGCPRPWLQKTCSTSSLRTKFFSTAHDRRFLYKSVSNMIINSSYFSTLFHRIISFQTSLFYAWLIKSWYRLNYDNLKNKNLIKNAENNNKELEQVFRQINHQQRGPQFSPRLGTRPRSQSFHHRLISRPISRSI